MADNKLYFSAVSELRELDNVDEANKLLDTGSWVLLKLGERASTTKEGSIVTPIYILGRLKA